MINHGTEIDVEREPIINPFAKKRDNTKKIRRIKRIIFIVLCGFALIHFLYMLIPMITTNRGMKAFGSVQVLAVPMGQTLVDDSFKVKLVRMTEFKEDDLEVGMQLVITSLRSLEAYWVEEIVEIDTENQIIKTTFDNFTINNTHYEAIEGVFLKESNFLGMLYYISTQPRGFVFMVLTDSMAIAAYYFAFIREKKKNLS
ncbi:MAG: hypothetical protein IH571_04835 [Acholeplasmataceae bacterium]|nr:hypothetical protein [Acholeplasmataceae bacterium]